MAIDRLAQPFDASEGEELEIVIENPESISMMDEDGGMIIDFDPNAPELMGVRHDSNLAEFMSDGDLDALASELVAQFES
ncbi:MAG: hypothetical protein VW445_13075, partial [Rhodospirillaceae bacterium]